jgi:Fe-S-cluster containining protein
MATTTDSDIEAALLGPLVAGRVCGACTICCTTLKVDTPDLRKPAGVACSCLGARGCSIHPVRPVICRTWFCGWRRVAAMPDAARPDRGGLLVSLSFEREPRNCLEGVAITVRILEGSTAIADGSAAAVLDALCDRLVPVWVSDGSSKMLVHPEGEVARHVLEGTSAPAHLRDEVQAWRDRYGVFGRSGRDGHRPG